MAMVSEFCLRVVWSHLGVIMGFSAYRLCHYVIMLCIMLDDFKKCLISSPPTNHVLRILSCFLRVFLSAVRWVCEVHIFFISLVFGWYFQIHRRRWDYGDSYDGDSRHQLLC